MIIKNLAQLKREIGWHNFEVVNHYVFPERSGEVRFVSKMQTNGMYSHILRNGDKSSNDFNGGRGLWCSFGKAKDWQFDGELCTLSFGGHPVWTIRLLDEEPII